MGKSQFSNIKNAILTDQPELFVYPFLPVWSYAGNLNGKSSCRAVASIHGNPPIELRLFVVGGIACRNDGAGCARGGYSPSKFNYTREANLELPDQM